MDSIPMSNPPIKPPIWLKLSTLQDPPHELKEVMRLRGLLKCLVACQSHSYEFGLYPGSIPKRRPDTVKWIGIAITCYYPWFCIIQVNLPTKTTILIRCLEGWLTSRHIRARSIKLHPKRPKIAGLQPIKASKTAGTKRSVSCLHQLP